MPIISIIPSLAKVYLIDTEKRPFMQSQKRHVPCINEIYLFHEACIIDPGENHKHENKINTQNKS